MRIANGFARGDNTSGTLCDRSMHSQSSLLQIFFTSELLDMEAFNGIFHLPPGSADIIYWPWPSLILAELDNNHDARIPDVGAFCAFRRFRDRSSHGRTQKERHPDQAPGTAFRASDHIAQAAGRTRYARGTPPHALARGHLH